MDFYNRSIDFFVALLFKILIAEGGVLLLILVTIITHRIIVSYKTKKEKEQADLLEAFFFNLVQTKEPFDPAKFPGEKHWTKAILVALERISLLIRGDDFFAMKKNVVDMYLIQKARAWAKHKRWIKKNLAGRIFSLYSEPRDEEALIKLLQDEHYLVRNPACRALLHLESKEGIRRIILAIKNEPGYAQFLYRDFLIAGSDKVLDIFIDFAKDPELHLQVLDILAARSWGKQLSFLAEDLISQDLKVYALALKVLIRNPLPESSAYFVGGLIQNDPQIRITAYKGLRFFPPSNAEAIFLQGMQDEDWDVRVEAARGLKSLGEIGIKKLQEQQDGICKEAAQYAINFEW